jgi:medium-chain acyl-[acyl-carrier-protein] hydrolase
LRLRKKAPAAAWFPGADAVEGLRLFCLPHAGGGTTGYAAWKDPRVCPVRLPGRESRAAEAPFENMAALVEALASAIESYTGCGFALFGHSMGAAIAFELTRELRRRGLRMPKVLIASGARAPQFRRAHIPGHAPTDTELLDELRKLEGVPADLLNDAAVMRAILPVLRADASLYRHYVYAEGAPLDVPLRAYGGIDDVRIEPAHLEAWREQTTSSFAVRRFPGGHFYLHDAARVLAAIREDLSVGAIQ